MMDALIAFVAVLLFFAILAIIDHRHRMARYGRARDAYDKWEAEQRRQRDNSFENCNHEKGIRATSCPPHWHPPDEFDRLENPPRGWEYEDDLRETDS